MMARPAITKEQQIEKDEYYRLHPEYRHSLHPSHPRVFLLGDKMVISVGEDAPVILDMTNEVIP